MIKSGDRVSHECMGTGTVLVINQHGFGPYVPTITIEFDHMGTKEMLLEIARDRLIKLPADPVVPMRGEI